jgi:hypothetical protein
MDGRRNERLRLALVDLDAARLDRARAVVAAHGDDGGGDAPDAQVRLVVSPDRTTVPWRWAALAGVPRAGEVAALAETIVDVVLIADESPRADVCARLAASLGARVLRVPAREGGRR